MAHVRRKFVEALVVQPKQAKTQSKKQTQNTTNPPTLAEQAVAMIGQLYAIEKQYKDASNIERQKARHLQSIPILNTLHAWLQTNRANVPPQMALGKAMTYLANCWPRLIRYTELGDLPIDNNWCENAIRPFVMGRKAWLFSDTASGANASAIIYSMIQTAKANGQEPSTWLRHVLQALPTAKTVDDYDALMPWNVQLLPKTTITN